jgi:acyl-CoA reductase-like NAD-dependent aldehyde dehydrogenase
VAINDYVRSDVTTPFGGMKDSGFGRELGEIGLTEFANLRWIGS